MHRGLYGSSAGLVVASLLGTLLLSAVSPVWAGEHPTLLALLVWATQAALVLGAALLAAGLVVARLAPPPAVRRDPAADSPSDWFA